MIGDVGGEAAVSQRERLKAGGDWLVDGKGSDQVVVVGRIKTATPWQPRGVDVSTSYI